MQITILLSIIFIILFSTFFSNYYQYSISNNNPQNTANQKNVTANCILKLSILLSTLSNRELINLIIRFMSIFRKFFSILYKGKAGKIICNQFVVFAAKILTNLQLKYKLPFPQGFQNHLITTPKNSLSKITPKRFYLQKL